ncbi:MAG TPA: MYXO-CTERM sorting domain-containing protein, partial [Pirellulales bacterium]|nr:MYXO-CTERM sorting domain-containing protein [Pirellulales bacterium]
SWTQLDHPSATHGTTPHGVDGANVVGWYLDSNGKPHGFMVTATSPVPEPATLLLALVGLALLPRRRRRSG